MKQLKSSINFVSGCMVIKYIKIVIIDYAIFHPITNVIYFKTEKSKVFGTAV